MQKAIEAEQQKLKVLINEVRVHRRFLKYCKENGVPLPKATEKLIQDEIDKLVSKKKILGYS
ncbi:hypothetical protein F9B85_13285 [Heliorestis acidaminivorans]|uniref:Uncharacterized protein n=1 Tax=Heliorestis acidaminivorans TaxID=553427 RepID=A0A6I0EXG0_9FIRM|nr:hypothetical protein [Heliorestis acidaminivorans]KAB2951174.1 hypothetical protein F9B85_13285 [Heliorestis acidaminivorans]